MAQVAVRLPQFITSVEKSPWIVVPANSVGFIRVVIAFGEVIVRSWQEVFEGLSSSSLLPREE